DRVRLGVKDGEITLDPLAPSRCTANSFDLTLGHRAVSYTDEVQDPLKPPTVHAWDFPKDGYTMAPGEFLLAETGERLGSDHFVPMIHGKSGTARLGLLVHVYANLIDLVFVGNITLLMYALRTLLIR